MDTNTKGKYQGQDVTVLRPARQGDKDFNASVEQVVIKTADGSEKTVAKNDVKPA
jgi:hypothetical protein